MPLLAVIFESKLMNHLLFFNTILRISTAQNHFTYYISYIPSCIQKKNLIRVVYGNWWANFLECYLLIPREKFGVFNYLNSTLNLSHCVKSVQIRNFSGPYFAVFGLETEIYSINFRIQSKCEKMWTRKTPYLDNFYAVPISIECFLQILYKRYLNEVSNKLFTSTELQWSSRVFLWLPKAVLRLQSQ